MNGPNKLDCLSLASLFSLVKGNTLAYWTHSWVMKRVLWIRSQLSIIWTSSNDNKDHGNATKVFFNGKFGAVNFVRTTRLATELACPLQHIYTVIRNADKCRGNISLGAILPIFNSFDIWCPSLWAVPLFLVENHFADRHLVDTAMSMSFGRQAFGRQAFGRQAFGRHNVWLT